MEESKKVQILFTDDIEEALGQKAYNWTDPWDRKYGIYAEYLPFIYNNLPNTLACFNRLVEDMLYTFPENAIESYCIYLPNKGIISQERWVREIYAQVYTKMEETHYKFSNIEENSITRKGWNEYFGYNLSTMSLDSSSSIKIRFKTKFHLDSLKALDIIQAIQNKEWTCSL